ncbi:hypothetical protein T06_15366, partial [Trichinella sp. T6]
LRKCFFTYFVWLVILLEKRNGRRIGLVCTIMLLLLVVLLNFVVDTSLARKAACSLNGSGQPNNPGVLLQLTNNGLKNMKDAVAKAINNEVPRFTLGTLTSGSKLGVSYDVNNLVITRFQPARDIQVTWAPTVQPQLIVQGRGMSAQLEASLTTSSILLSSQIFVINLQDISFRVAFMFGIDAARKLFVRIGDCSFSYGLIDVGGDDISGLRLASNIINSLVERRLQDFFDGNLCDTLQNDGTIRLNQWLHQIPSEISLHDKPGGRFPRSVRFRNVNPDHLLADLARLITELTWDLGVVAAPTVRQAGTTRFMEIPLRGEVKLRGHSSAPFYPKRPPVITKNHYHHFYLLLADYTINSLFYHLYNTGMLNVTVDGSRSSAEISDFLQNGCDEGGCAGELLNLPATKRQYLELRLYPFTCPSVQIRRNQGVLLDMPLTMQLWTTMGHPKQLLFSRNIRSKGLLMLKARGAHITPSFTVQSIEIENQQENSSPLIVDLAKMAVEAKLNELLGNGFTIPPLGIGRLTDVMFQYEDNAIWVGVNVIIDSASFQKSFHDMIENAKNRVQYGGGGGAGGAGGGGGDYYYYY